MAEGQESEELAYLRQEVRRLRESLHAMTPAVDILLRRRGFQIFRKNPSGDLLIPSPEHLDGYYRMLHKYSFRLFLRDVIKHQRGFSIETVARYASREATADFIGYLVKVGLAERRGDRYAVVRGPVRSFGETLEWYVAEIFRREFSAEAVWGATFKRSGVGGDYDVLAKLDSSLCYLEVKSSPPKQIYDREVAAFLDRVGGLSPEIAVFLVDTELRMKDKIVPMFTEELQRRAGEPVHVERIEGELFRARERVYIVNAKGSIVGNIERILRRCFRGCDGNKS